MVTSVLQTPAGRMIFGRPDLQSRFGFAHALWRRAESDAERFERHRALEPVHRMPRGSSDRRQDLTALRRVVLAPREEHRADAR